MKVVFLAPAYPPEMIQYTRGLAEVGAEVYGVRDKEIMKERVRAAGLRVPRSRRVRTEKEVRAAAEEIGFPLILKPIAGAGSADTYQVRTQAELEETLPKIRGVKEASCEEYI